MMKSPTSECLCVWKLASTSSPYFHGCSRHHHHPPYTKGSHYGLKMGPIGDGLDCNVAKFSCAAGCCRMRAEEMKRRQKWTNRASPKHPVEMDDKLGTVGLGEEDARGNEENWVRNQPNLLFQRRAFRL